MAEKKWSEIVLDEREKGNVVCILLPDTWGTQPVSEIVKQPADGLLWDLNRDEATALTFMDQEGMIHWVNNFAVALVIRELKRRLDEEESEASAMRAALRRMPEWGMARDCQLCGGVEPEHYDFIMHDLRQDIGEQLDWHRGHAADCLRVTMPEIWEEMRRKIDGLG